MKRLSLLVLLGLYSAGAFCQVYKWVDEDGIVHYGDSPPEKTKAERVDIEARSTEHEPPASTKMVKDAEESYRRLEEERKLKRAGRLAADQARLERKQDCVYWRKQLISLQQQLPVYRDEEGKFRTLSQYDAYEGEREYLDDATRAREIHRINREITTTCEKPGDQAEEIAAGQERMREKRCEVARLKLKEAQQDNKAPRQEIRDAQAEVNQFCGTGN